MTTLIIAGHGLRPNGTFDPGATGLIKKGEHKYMVEDLFPAMKRHLPKNHDVVFYTAKDVYSTNNLVSLVKKHNAKEVIEIHYDAASATATGGHVIIHKNYKPDKLDLALRDAIKDMVGTIYTHKGESGINGRDNLANVNRAANAGIPYRLVELGFGTNKHDTDVLVNQTDAYAKRLVEAIVGKTSNKPTTNTSSKPKKQSKPKPIPEPTTNKNKPKANLTVDGLWGQEVNKALQRYFGLNVVDGILSNQWKSKANAGITSNAIIYNETGKGSPTVEAIQAFFNIKKDGLLGKVTIQRFQSRFGLKVDGEIWRPSPMVEELQRRLNKGEL